MIYDVLPLVGFNVYDESSSSLDSHHRYLLVNEPEPTKASAV